MIDIQYVDHRSLSIKICLNKSNRIPSSPSINSPYLRLNDNFSFKFYWVISLNLNTLRRSINLFVGSRALFNERILQKMKLSNYDECKILPFSRMILTKLNSSKSVKICWCVYLYSLTFGMLFRYPKWGWTSFIIMTGFRGRSTLKACEYSYPNLMNLLKANLSSFLSLAVSMASKTCCFCT